MLAVTLYSATLLLLVDCIHFTPKSLIGTEFDSTGLTQKQVGILRYFLRQTKETWNQTDPWKDWYVNPNQDDNDALRYTISGIGYSVALSAHRTPAYNQLYQVMLKNVIQRMVSVKVWHYVDYFELYRRQPTYPDPVAYKNIMYSGHVAQLIALYEEMSGDMHFSEVGWDFIWNKTTVFHYNTKKLYDAITHQMALYYVGGVPCEPHSVFIICNNFPHNSFVLYDSLHNTTYSTTNQFWQHTVMKKGHNDEIPPITANYFNLDRLFLDDKDPIIGDWVNVATLGSDAWALAWMRPWWNESIDANHYFLYKGWLNMYNSKRWKTDAHNSSHIVPNDIGNLFTFPYGADVTTSFYPMIEKQYYNTSDVKQPKMYSTLNWFESNYGTSLDLNNDGRTDAYMYNSSKKYHDWSTANLLASFTIPKLEEDADYLRNIFRPKSSPLFRQFNKYPHVQKVDIPVVMVKQAWFNQTTNELHVSLVQVDGNRSGYHNVSLGFDVQHYKLHPSNIICDGVEHPIQHNIATLPLPLWKGEQECIAQFLHLK